MALDVRETTQVSGGFATPAQARLAVEELKKAGIPENQINLVLRDQPQPEELRAPTTPRVRGRLHSLGTMVGAGIGIALGAIGAAAVPGISPNAVAGVLVATLGIGAFGAALGGWFGSMAEYEPPQVDPYYDDVVEDRRRILVTVLGSGRDDEVAAILNRAGADYVELLRKTFYGEEAA